MVLVLDYVPTPSFSDGTRDFYPEVFKTHRQPAGVNADLKERVGENTLQ